MLLYEKATTVTRKELFIRFTSSTTKSKRKKGFNYSSYLRASFLHARFSSPYSDESTMKP